MSNYYIFPKQATLQSNGDIIFVYETIPRDLSSFEANETARWGTHFLAGISDSFLMDGTLYEYSKVDVQLKSVKSSTVVKFMYVSADLV